MTVGGFSCTLLGNGSHVLVSSMLVAGGVPRTHLKASRYVFPYCCHAGKGPLCLDANSSRLVPLQQYGLLWESTFLGFYIVDAGCGMRLPVAWSVCSPAVSTCKAPSRNMLCTMCGRLPTLLLRKFFNLPPLPHSTQPFPASLAKLACGVNAALLLTDFEQCGVQVPTRIYPPRARPHRKFVSPRPW